MARRRRRARARARAAAPVRRCVLVQEATGGSREENDQRQPQTNFYQLKLDFPEGPERHTGLKTENLIFFVSNRRRLISHIHIMQFFFPEFI